MSLEALPPLASLIDLEDLRGGLISADAQLLLTRVDRDNTSLLGMVADAFAMGVNVTLNTLHGRQTCRICGCWELHACPPTCSWVEADLCSACVGGSDA